MSCLPFDLIKANKPHAPTVVFSAGLGGTAGFWKPQVSALTGRFNLLTYDQRGTGRARTTLPNDHSIADMAQDVADTIRTASVGPCHLVGHALGGLIGLQLALECPALLTSLTAVNAWARPNPHTLRCFNTRRQLLASAGIRAYVEALPLFLYSPVWNAAHDTDIQAEIEQGLADFQGESNLLSRIQALLSFDVSERLYSIRIRTLVCAARDDTLVPWTSSAYLAESMPNAQLAIVDTGGHGLTATDPITFNRNLLGFLNNGLAA